MDGRLRGEVLGSCLIIAHLSILSVIFCLISYNIMFYDNCSISIGGRGRGRPRAREKMDEIRGGKEKSLSSLREAVKGGLIFGHISLFLVN